MRDDRPEAHFNLKSKPSSPPEPRNRGNKRDFCLYSRDNNKVDLKDLYYGSSIFLLLSGPSLLDSPLECLREINAYTFGVNNSWSVYRPTFWTCMDGVEKFLSGGWRDPRITKLIPNGKQNHQLRTKTDKGFFNLSTKAGDCPGVLYYNRNLELDPTTFLTESTVNWGQDGKTQDLLGIKGCRSVMLAAVRLCYYLGFRTIYMLGCDFNMTPGKQNYAFPQDRWDTSIQGNNNTYEGLRRRFKALQSHFENHGLKIFNCNPDSKLDTIRHKPIEEALEEYCNSLPEMEDTLGWYDKEKTIKTVRRNGK